MLLNKLQSTRQRITQSKLSTLLRLRNPDLIESFACCLRNLLLHQAAKMYYDYDCSFLVTLPRDDLHINLDISFFFFFCLFVFSRAAPRHMEVPRLGVQSEPQPPAYTTATATPDPSCTCNLHHGSRQRRILNLPSEARDRIRILMVPSQIR